MVSTQNLVLGAGAAFLASEATGVTNVVEGIGSGTGQDEDQNIPIGGGFPGVGAGLPNIQFPNVQLPDVDAPDVSLPDTAGQSLAGGLLGQTGLNDGLLNIGPTLPPWLDNDNQGQGGQGGKQSQSSKKNQGGQSSIMGTGDPFSPVEELQFQADQTVASAGQGTRSIFGQITERLGDAGEGAATGAAVGSLSPDPVTTGAGAVVGGVGGLLFGDTSQGISNAASATGDFIGSTATSAYEGVTSAGANLVGDIGFGQDQIKDTEQVKQSVDPTQVSSIAPESSIFNGSGSSSDDEDVSQSTSSDNVSSATPTPSGGFTPLPTADQSIAPEGAFATASDGEEKKTNETKQNMSPVPDSSPAVSTDDDADADATPVPEGALE